MFTRFCHFLAQPAPAQSLALLRVAYVFVFGVEILDLFWSQGLVVDDVPLLVADELGPEFGLLAWLPVLFCLLIGFQTRTAALLNYGFSLFTFSVTREYRYQVDSIYVATNLLLIFAPVSRIWSVDALLAKLRNPMHALRAPASTVALGWPLLFVISGIGLVYWDSVLYKLDSRMWRAGLGLWLPASLPQDTWLPPAVLGPLLNTSWLVKGLGYSTIAFELLFMFLVWFRRTHGALIVIGCCFHLGILIAFPIPLFGLVEVSLYAALIPLAWWEWLSRKARTRSPTILPLTASNVAEARRAILLKSLDLRDAIRVELAAPDSTSIAYSEALARAVARTPWPWLAERLVRRIGASP